MRKLTLLGLVTLLAIHAIMVIYPVRAADPIDALLNQMTVEQRVGQLFMVSFFGENLNDKSRAFLETMQPGGLALFSYNGTTPPKVTRFINAAQAHVTAQGGGLPLIIAIDHEGGTVVRLGEGFTALPWGGALSAMPSADAATVGAMAAQELSAVGITMNLAPVADLSTQRGAVFMERRTFGHDPARVGAAIASYVKGIQGGGVAAVLKHFPGHGSAGDSHAFLPTVKLTRDQIEQVELIPFKAGIAAGAEAVMVGHLDVPALDATGKWPATLSRPIVTGLLRERLGFAGLIMTDAMDMRGLSKDLTPGQAALLALDAGIDVLVTGPHMGMQDQLRMRQALLDAVVAGTLTEARLNESVRRILIFKQKHELLKWSPVDLDQVEARIDSAGNTKTVAGIYQRTVALASNAEGLVPFTAGKQIVLVIFPNQIREPLRACAKLDPMLRSYGYDLDPQPVDLENAPSLARAANRVAIFTFDIDDHPLQAELVNRLPLAKTVVVAMRNPYDIERQIAPRAYLTAFNPAPAAMQAACEILYGVLQPQGVWTLR